MYKSLQYVDNESWRGFKMHSLLEQIKKMTAMKRNKVEPYKLDDEFMRRFEVRVFRKQSLAALWLIATEKRGLSAVEIADRLGISPRNVAKVMKPLVQARLVLASKVPMIPDKTRYHVLSMQYVERRYMAFIQLEFRTMFSEARH